MKELTEKARKWALTHTSGAGTMKCHACGGPKEERRLNSHQCGRCQNGGEVTHRVTVTLPADVMAALVQEATGKGRTVAEHLEVLVTTRHNRAAPAVKPAPVAHVPHFGGVGASSDDVDEEADTDAYENRESYTGRTSAVKRLAQSLAGEEGDADDLRFQFDRDRK